MLRRIFLTAILAGFAAGLLLAALQAVATVPLVLQAESYESGGASSTHSDDATSWAPADGFERVFYTTLADVLTAVGFALLLTAAFALHGRPVDGRRGALWGLAGFAVFSLAPAFGLPPELPGTMAADLSARQGWWLATVGATGIGLWLVVLGRSWLRGLGALLIAAPHVVGAPESGQIGGPVPPELAGHFAASVLAVMAVFWAVLGWLAGTLFARLQPSARRQAALAEEAR